MKKYIISIITTVIFASSCQKQQTTTVTGSVMNPTDSIVTINDSIIALNEQGEFLYTSVLNEPAPVKMVYNNAEILLYLKPSGRLIVKFEGSDMVNTIHFEGTDAEVNQFLVSLARHSLEVSPWFEKNWYNLYAGGEADFIQIIDSLQNTFFDLFDSFKIRQTVSDSLLIQGLIADTYFSFNRLILLYPSQHEQFTGVVTVLGNQTLDRLVKTNINDPRFIDLDYYESYCRDWIEYNLQYRIKNSSSGRNYYLRRMDELFLLLPEMFSNNEVRDFWLAGYLSGHIHSYGVSNSREYIDQYKEICVTPKYRKQVEKAYEEIMNANSDHSVEVFKTINGFNLEAHLFFPGTGLQQIKRPAIVLFHGGGWSEGNPSWAFSRARHFARKGMVAVAAQYRLSNKAEITPVEGMKDARDVIRWMRSKGDSLGVEPDSIVAYGWSAGGHLAAAAAIFPEDRSVNGNTSPDALVLVSPALDLVNDGWSQYLLGSRADIRTISPVEHVRKNLPPAIILQGRDDTVTPLEGARLFHERMVNAGNDCELWIYDGVGHLFTPSTMKDDGWPQPDPNVQQEGYEQADHFLKKRGFIH